MLLNILPTFEKEKSKENQLSTYKLLTNVYHNTAQPDSAEFYFEKYIALDNELVNTNVISNTTELEKVPNIEERFRNSSTKSKIFKEMLRFSSLVFASFRFCFYRNRQHRQKVEHQKPFSISKIWLQKR